MNIVADQFSKHMEATARKLWGDPVAGLSSAAELRWGTQGSKAVDLEKGTFYDHEAKEGGGVLALIEREAGHAGPEAVEWLRREVGAVIEDTRRPPVAQMPKRIVKTYDYVDEGGEVLTQVVRYEPKDFRQRRPDPSAPDGWNWSVKGVRQIPYRLPELIEAIAIGMPVFVVEGEKDVDRLAKRGVVATCNAGGAGKWPASFAEFFKGADVVILPDNDEAGRNHRDIVASGLRGVAASVRVLDLPGLPPKGDVSDWIDAGGDGPALYTLVEGARPWSPAPPASRFGAIAWADMDAVAVRQDYLVEDMMFVGDVGMVYGASGSGKSFLCVDMGLAIARGVPFLGKQTRHGHVIYQAGEGGRGLVKRLKAYRQHHHLGKSGVSFTLLPERVDLFSKDGDTEAFIEECLALKACATEPLSLIVIDTFSTASPGANENASEDMGRMLVAGEKINKATGAAVIYVHHKNAAGDRERGHTSLRANIDTAIEVIRDEETSKRILRLAKLKEGEDGLKIGFELQPVEIGTYDSGKPMTSCVVVPAEVESPRAGKLRLPAGQHNFLKVLDEAIRRKGGIVPAGDHCPSGTYGVAYPDFRDLYVALCGAGKEPGAIRTAISRDGDALWRGGFMDRTDDWFWITQKGDVAIR